MQLQNLIKEQKSEGKLSAPSLAAASSLYVHIPFCQARCLYCDFYTKTACGGELLGFCHALLNQLDSLIHDRQIAVKPLETLYFGGGTPSLIAPDFYKEFIGRLEANALLAPEPEITLEANPSSFNLRRADGYLAAGINRLSLGLQTSDDLSLQELGRKHDLRGFLRAYEAARTAGFQNISTDLIFGLPGQSMEGFAKDLDCLFALDVEHFSAYSLILAENTAFYRHYIEDYDLGLRELPSEELERAFYYRLKKEAKAQGFEHYEISSFAKQGYQSQHNNRYWQLVPYLALGPAASGYYAGVRYQIEADLNKFLRIYSEPGTEYLEMAILEEVLSESSERQDYILLGFRKMAGISADAYRIRFKRELSTDYGPELAELCRRGLIYQQLDSYRLTPLGEDLANQVFEVFI
ncbi:MAG: radical SAM family heme chaperone HemW [Eubacteriales bacterium]|nr:radical SAM family heme chaperone HemW [Eubacteriales bacterium]